MNMTKGLVEGQWIRNGGCVAGRGRWETIDLHSLLSHDGQSELDEKGKRWVSTLKLEEKKEEEEKDEDGGGEDVTG